MSKKYNIRWRDSDYKELQRVINNYNAKLYRLNKNPNFEGKEFLPSKISKKDAIAGIQTRQDFNRFVNSLQRFSKRGSEKIVKSNRSARATQWEVNEYNITKRAENRRKAQKVKEIGEQNVTIAGKDTGVKRAQMGSIRQNELKPNIRKFQGMSQKEWDIVRGKINKILTDAYRSARKQMLKDNYIAGANRLNYPSSFIQLVQRVPLDLFVMKHETDEVCHIDFLYDPIDLSWKVSIISSAWEQALREYETAKQIEQKE